MAMAQKQRFPSNRWSRWGSAVSAMTFSGFVLICLYAKWSPALGADAASSHSALVAQAQKDAKGAKAKKKQLDQAKAPAPVKSSILGPIPGAGKKLDYHELAKIIDTEVAKRLDAEGIKASPKSDDAEFLRRVYLDLVGVIPTADKVDAFLQDTDPAKRSKLIDELL